jgi:hypothetical protein
MEEAKARQALLISTDNVIDGLKRVTARRVIERRASSNAQRRSICYPHHVPEAKVGAGD